MSARPTSVNSRSVALLTWARNALAASVAGISRSSRRRLCTTLT